jgi:hypothetical protein
MGVAGEAATAVAGRFVVELKAQREDEGQDELDEGLAITKELRVGGLIVEINGDRAVFAGCFSGLSHVSSPYRR